MNGKKKSSLVVTVFPFHRPHIKFEEQGWLSVCFYHAALKKQPDSFQSFLMLSPVSVMEHKLVELKLSAGAGYIQPECSSSSFLSPTHNLLASQLCDEHGTSDLETMGLLSRGHGFSEQLIMDDSARAALLDGQKMSVYRSAKSDIEDGWQLGSGPDIELHNNPSGRDRHREQSSTEIVSTKEWYEGSNPGRVCKSCGAWQLLRARHCHDCKQCVEKFDHHCYWIGTCIGRGNHHIFWAFLFSQTSLIVLSLALILEGMSSAEGTKQMLRSWFMIWIAALLPLVVGLVLVGGLFLFHTYLLCTNQTTFEVAARWKVDYLKDLPPNKNPFDQGCTQNLADGCCLGPGHAYRLPNKDVVLTTMGVIAS